MASVPPGRLSIFNVPEIRTVAVSVMAAGVVSMASAFVSSRGDAQVVAERLNTHARRIDVLEEITRDLAAAQSAQAQAAASVAATQQAMAAMLQRHDQDIRDARKDGKR